MFDLGPYETEKKWRHPSRGYMMVKYHWRWNDMYLLRNTEVWFRQRSKTLL